MSKKILRLYFGITDPEMLTGAETLRELFENDQAQFLNSDPSFDNAFKNDWDAKIDSARHAPSDDAANNNIGVANYDLIKAWNACKQHFQDSKYYIRKAFPDKAKQNQFGFNDYRIMSRNPRKVTGFMDLFHYTAEANKVALIAQGYTQAKIDLIETLCENFRTAMRAKQKVKKDRFTQTHDRTTKMNDVWKMLQEVNRASKSIFRNNPAKRQQYLLPHARQHTSIIGL